MANICDICLKQYSYDFFANLSATCFHVELEQFWHAFASRGFVSDSWPFLLYLLSNIKTIYMYLGLLTYLLVIWYVAHTISLFTYNRHS